MLPRFLRPAVGATLATSLLSSSLTATVQGQTAPSQPAPASAPAAAAPAAPTPAPTPEPAPPPPTIAPSELFTVPEGLEVTVWATTPQLRNPTNIDFDKDGRLWVAEGVNYRSHSGRQKAGDRIVVLSDTDADGKADQSEAFI